MKQTYDLDVFLGGLFCSLEWACILYDDTCHKGEGISFIDGGVGG